MYKDSKGNYLMKGSVVVNQSGFLYNIEDFDNSREYFVKLRNGCTICYDKPEDLTCVYSVEDLS